MKKTYDELITLGSYAERLKYLKLSSIVGRATFDTDRYLNQVFYTSHLWRSVRAETISRDYGCDIAIQGMTIGGFITIHHINPITVQDIMSNSPDLVELDNLVCVSTLTHRYIHYGIEPDVIRDKRKQDDHILWKRRS